MNSLHNDATRLKADLQNMAHDIDRLLNGAADSADTRARRALRDGRQRLRAAATQTQAFVHRRPWQLIGAVAAAAFLLGMLARSRRETR